MNGRLRPPLAVALWFGLAGATPGTAELVIMVDGRVLKATTYATTGIHARIELASGGSLTVPLERVERVVDDEIALDADPFEEILVELRFRDDQPIPDTPYGQLIYDTAKRHSVNPELVVAIVRVESGFDEQAALPTGARGLMPLMPATARRLGLGLDELLDAEINLDAGVRYLVELGARYRHNFALMLAAYKAGEETVERYRGVPPFRETRDFIRQVHSFLATERTSSSAEGRSPGGASTGLPRRGGHPT